MYDFPSKGCFPAPHSPAISMPEFLQELYTKINECVEAVNECITMVDTSSNIVEKWNTVKAKCDMVMEQYANTMGEYEDIILNYMQTLEDLEGRVYALNASTTHLETLVEGCKNEIEQKAEEVLAEITVLADSIVEVGTANGWYYRKYKSGRVEAIKWVYIDPKGRVSYQGNDNYLLDYELTYPFTMTGEKYFWLQPCAHNTTAYITGIADTYALIWMNANHDFYDYDSVDICIRMEGTISEET